MKKIILSALAILLTITAFAEEKAEKKVRITGGGDIVSSYIWRGSYNAGASIQPTLALEGAGFRFGAWGSVEFAGKNKKEVDLSLSYTWKGLTVGITDYWWAGEGAFSYFHYSKGATSHLFEANVSYQLPVEKFPLIISWNTMFAGADDNNYSTYIELCYPFAAGPVEMTATVGAAPWRSPAFLASDNKGFSVCNVAIGARYPIRFSDKFSLPIFSQLIFNPATEDIHLVFGLSLKF